MYCSNKCADAERQRKYRDSKKKGSRLMTEYYSCVICGEKYNRDIINEQNEFIIFKNLKFICPSCKNELKDVLQEDEDYIECPNQFCVCA
jgi:hypothetical protein